MLSITKLKHSASPHFFLMAGPCAIEGRDMALRIAEHIVSLTDRLQIPYIFKGSYRKANRTKLDSFTGIGDEKALKILKEVGDTFGVPTVTDIHEAAEAAMAAEYVDVLQIPAFLCRQTDLLVAAAQTGKAVNVKKGPVFRRDLQCRLVRRLNLRTLNSTAQQVINKVRGVILLIDQCTCRAFTINTELSAK